ncbi:unnamed protein product, partial [Medioppia subpectinata]
FSNNQQIFNMSDTVPVQHGRTTDPTSSTNSKPKPEEPIYATVNKNMRSNVVPAMNCEKVSRKKEITIVLLGESGVGKSTFINALVNYLSYESLNAANGQPICIIPICFTLTNPSTWEPVKVTLGEHDMNENTDDPTQSATQYPKCYKFEDDKIVVNIIDTPGIGDTDGVDRDNRNMQNILDFISNYREINAFCVLLKPNEARLDVLFNAANNILFLFTNSRSTHYMPGDSGPALMSILQQIKERPPNVDIPYNENSIYCFDSESFRYLVASVPPNNVKFDSRFKSTYIESWDRFDLEECQRLFAHISHLPTHQVMDTLSLNNAKQIIQIITKPLADIIKNIADNVKQCETYKIQLKAQPGIATKQEIPSVELVYYQLHEPKTVCTDVGCVEQTEVNGITTTIYPRPCHLPCYLKYSDGSIMGDKGLLKCRAFNKHNSKDNNPNKIKTTSDKFTESYLKLPGIFLAKTAGSNFCLKCSHSIKHHMHMTYETKAVLKTVPVDDSNTRVKSVTAEGPEPEIQRLDRRIADLNDENHTIVNSMAMFACFLANNTLTACSDAFDDYVQHLIDSAVDSEEPDSRATIDRYEQLLNSYRHEKQTIIDNLPDRAVITAENISL